MFSVLWGGSQFTKLDLSMAYDYKYETTNKPHNNPTGFLGLASVPAIFKKEAFGSLGLDPRYSTASTSGDERTAPFTVPPVCGPFSIPPPQLQLHSEVQRHETRATHEFSVTARYINDTSKVIVNVEKRSRAEFEEARSILRSVVSLAADAASRMN
ncbi:unnamed protein product [Euphydryas editha]|uniref:Uncharacterized protein n=1 Tax=Euphydryas editha TaxID=104508 RepID=A0AAU9TZN5_EUPED|nr:unnamed protein product [Euphydryas editha]